MLGIVEKPVGIEVRLVEYTEDGERLVAISSKVSLSSKQAEKLLDMGEEEVEVWIRETFRRMHFSPWEHSTYTFLVDGLSRVASHQLVRHRHASYTQLSHRYSEGYLRRAALKACRRLGLSCPEKPKEDPRGRREAYNKYAQALLRLQAEGGHSEVFEAAWEAFVIPPTMRDLDDVVREYIRGAGVYYSLLAQGVRREDARYVLPHSLRTRIVVSMNARELVQVFFPLRMCTKAQWEIRHVAWLMWRELSKVHPRLFRWAGPSCVFRENTSRQQPAPLRDYLDGREAFTIPRCPELVERPAIPACLKVAARVEGGDGEFE
ncbi:MAG: FAD-dependent thymidylate synthase [Aeropyrum sp.]|nr:FAD-dependent thymidylate synthase [Aeropyrum sp.]MCE4616409.1 FAD-dependent thymidylate synthase [Aeropyrum sp.]